MFVPLLLSAVVLGGAPSDHSCLVAWNAASNHAGHAKLVAEHPTGGLFLEDAVSSTLTEKNGKLHREITNQTCALVVGKSGQMQTVTGTLIRGKVARWTWGGAVTATHFKSNVKALADGRLLQLEGR